MEIFPAYSRGPGYTRGNLSSHMDKLEEAGYIAVIKEFVEKIPRTLIRLTDEGREAIEDYKRNMKHVLDELLG
jgi:DNA-binding MarR family transcriptional regulator